MADSALDSILGSGNAFPGNDVGSALSSVASIRQVNGAFLVDIQRTDVQSGQSAHDLVRLDEAGQIRASVRIDGAMQIAERTIANTLFGTEEPGLFLAGRAELVDLAETSSDRLAAIAALSLDRIDHMQEWRGHLVIAGEDRDAAPVLYTMIGERAPQALPLDRLQLSDTRRISVVHGAGETLHVAVADPVKGFDLYRFDLTAPTAEAAPLLSLGAQRFALNAAVAGMLQHPKGLLLGTAALAGPKRPVGQWGPELLLLSADGSWDLLIGQPRFAPSGLILPASGLAPGLGASGNAAIRAMHSDGVMTVIALQDHAGPTEEDRRKASLDLSEYHGALRLYASFDLEEWTELPHDLPRSIGAVTSLHVTEEQLFVGHEALGAQSLPVSLVPLSA